jgi:hypothetical protein
MSFEFESFVVGINVLSFSITSILGFLTYLAMRGGTLGWSAAMFFLVGVLCLSHSAAEIFELADEIKGMSALGASFATAFSVIILEITSNMMGVKK